MPRKAAPGVFVEETSFRAKAIEGVGTTTTAFIGPTLSGPVGAPPLLRSYADFEQTYGKSGDLGFAPSLNHIAHAARVFFAEGGTRLYVARVVAKAKTAASASKTVPKLADYDKAFALLAALPEISIVASPGHTAFPAATATGIAQRLVAHAEQLRYRVAVLDTPAGQAPADAKAYKAGFDSKLAALYYPWVVVANPNSPPAHAASAPELVLPPSGFICGVYARTDETRGVFKAPANVPVQSALRFERVVTANDQAMLNALGVNCLRSFPGQGNLVWGARTTASASEWKYVSITRYFAYLEHSIDAGTQWAVFEPNGEPLWANVRTAVSNFLFNEWRSGALLGIKPEQAYFVKCDRTTMTQDDLDNGRLICEVGVAPLKAAEFVIFRIGQKTAHARA